MQHRADRRAQPRLGPAGAIAAAAVFVALLPASPATAQEPVYENQEVSYGDETVSLDAPADWERQQLNEHSVGFDDYTAPGKKIVLDLAPVVDTVGEMRAERRSLRDLGRRYYREVGFRVNSPGTKVRVRWIFTYRDAQTEDTWSFTSVYLMRGNRLEVDGRRTQRDALTTIRDHVVRSVSFPGA